MPGVEDFNALRGVGEAAAKDPARMGYARYCELRAKGLRRPALEALMAFLDEARSWPFEARKAFCGWLCFHARAAHPEVMPHPLRVELVVPTLKEWTAREPIDPRPLFALGRFEPWSESRPDAQSRFAAALAMDPEFEPARLALIDILLAEVDFSQHHLPEAYIGRPAEDLMALNRAQALLSDLSAGEARRARQTDLDELRRQADHWRLYGKAPPETAPRSITIYYDP